MVCGHIHKAELRDVGGILYCNDGDWVESLSALAETHDGQLQLLDWAAIQAEHQAGRQADPSSRKPRSLSLPALPSALRRQASTRDNPYTSPLRNGMLQFTPSRSCLQLGNGRAARSRCNMLTT